MKRKISIGQLVSLIGTVIIGIGLILNAFELIPLITFRIIVIIGVVTQIAALILLWKKNEF